ncbi:nitroreductase family protein [Paenibacillus glycanilyticus]|uniref:nitroreductase family protein n=1 Tax=Paenibacillus glycanilyticus TaxID=126569 RepID=UPI00204016D6|nr:nitroreductase family protein [Paenibacillus glycanilyticus]MCM3627752.1 nitroreductase family protein [Paenibacillus glycanilyticus]
MKDFVSVVTERRSANKFNTGVPIEDKELHEIFDLVKYAPSSFNLQHAHYIVVRDEAMKQQVYEAANKQYKVQTASAVILVLGHMDAHQNVEEINEGLLNLGVINKQEYDFTVSAVHQFYEERGEAFKRDEAIRNANLSAMLFMLAAKEKGWDSSPMIGFDPEAIMKVLNVPDRYVPALLIGIGQEDTSKRRVRGYRKPVGEFVSYERF